jgi:hypothetical protein
VIQGVKPPPVIITDTIGIAMSIAQEMVLLLKKSRLLEDQERGNPSPSLDGERDALKL